MDQLRLALRTLFRAPGFTAAAVLILAVGVGGSTAMFSVLRSVMLRPLGFPHPGTERWMEFESPYPGDLDAALERLRAL